MSLLLALDTATQYASIALYDDGMVLAELNWRAQRRHTVELADQIQKLCTLQAVLPTQIQAVAVAIGPGSYTGARIALSYAKGLVAVRPLPLIAIPTLDCLAYAAPATEAPVCALVAAGRQRFCWAQYARMPNTLQRQSDWGLHTLPQILERLTQPTYLIGELDSENRLLLQHHREQLTGIAPPALAVRRGAILAELATQRWQQGDSDDPVTLSPIYLG